MKIKYLLLFLLPFVTFSQVTTTPSIPTGTGSVLITFNATGTNLEGISGDIYAHTGVTVDGQKWQNTIGAWGVNSAQPKLTKSSSNSNIYTLNITPSVYSFYNVINTKKITEISLVFRSADATKQTNPDIFIPIYEDGLNIKISAPTNGSVYNLNSSVSISAEATLNANLELFINGNSIKTASNSTTITSSYLLSTSGNFTIKAKASATSETKEAEITVFVKSPTQTAPKPSNAKKGITINTDNSVTFILEAPKKNEVFLIGDFNNWQLNTQYQLKKDSGNPDLFWITLPNLNPNTEYAYQYFVDYAIKIADPYSEKILDPWTDQFIKAGNYPNLKSYPTNLTTGYVSTFMINNPMYNWNVTNFEKPSKEKLVIYELHIRDFTETDSYKEAITKLDYLKNLGVNAVELLPVSEFEGADSWGYNPALYFALDKAYGTKNDFKKFVDECHKRGMAVIADVVFNHSYGQSPLLQLYFNSVTNKPAADNPWYNQNHNLVDNTSAHWGYDFNHESTYTTNFFKDVLSYWMNEYKVDGFRFDFTKGMSNTLYYGVNNWASAYDASRISILKNYATHVWNNNPTNKSYVIFEHLSDNSEEKELANYGIMLWGNMNHSYNQNTMGFGTDSNINWISYKQRGWDSPNVIGYMESHDEERLMYKNLQFGNSNATYNVKNLNTALARQELAGLFFFTIPGPKMIWQFGELGYDISIDNNGRVGRKPVYWNYFDNANRKQLYNTWATLIALKKKYPAFSTADFTITDNALSKSIQLKHNTMDVVIVGNFDLTSKTIATQFSKTGVWYEYFTGEERNITNTTTNIELSPGEYKLYSTVRILDPRGGTVNDDSDKDGVADTFDLCPNTPIGTTVNTTGCPVFSLSSTNFSITATDETCVGKNNGQLSITAQENYNYTATINGINYPLVNKTLTLTDLAPKDYNICIAVDGKNYQQCYVATINTGGTISAKSSLLNSKISIEIESGTAPYTVIINNQEVLETKASTILLDVKNGDLVLVKTAASCEGVFSTSIENLDNLKAFPNPTNGLFQIEITTSEKEVMIEIFNNYGQLISKNRHLVFNNSIQLNLEDKPTGLYLVKVQSKGTTKSVKVVKH